jgi:hypothetical protein
MNASFRQASAVRGFAWVGGLVATTAALAVGAVLTVFFAATVVLIAILTSAVLALTTFAAQARRTVRAEIRDPTLIEARNVGGHSWVAYGWNDRRS